MLKDEVFAIVGCLGTPTHSAVVDFLNDEGVPDLFVSSGSLQWGDDPETLPWTFGWQTDYESEGKIIGQYVAENMPDAKVGLFLQDDDFGADGEKGRPAVPRRPDRRDPALHVRQHRRGPQIAALQATGADLVLGFTTPSYTALDAADLAQARLQAEVVRTPTSGSDPTLVGVAARALLRGCGPGDGASSLDGVMTTKYLPGIDAARQRRG